MKLFNSGTYIVINDMSELKNAKRCRLCTHIIFERGNVIHMWEGTCGEWEHRKYSFFESTKDTDLETTGLEAYKAFYDYVGKEDIDVMKAFYIPIPIYESVEQMHYANIDYIGTKLYGEFFEYDANSSFTYGVLQLPREFDKLKKYMLELYAKKSNAATPMLRSRYKNLQNYLIGYFARVKDLVAVRSNIIKFSNENIVNHMAEIIESGGTVYLSNTDSIITDKIGSDIMQKYIGNNAGEFKLELSANKLYYEGSNYYQIGNKKVHSGVRWFAKRHTDAFNNVSAAQYGSLIEGYDFMLFEELGGIYKLCKVKYGKITVKVYNSIGELINEIIYKIGD